LSGQRNDEETREGEEERAIDPGVEGLKGSSHMETVRKKKPKAEALKNTVCRGEADKRNVEKDSKGSLPVLRGGRPKRVGKKGLTKMTET